MRPHVYADIEEAITELSVLAQLWDKLPHVPEGDARRERISEAEDNLRDDIESLIDSIATLKKTYHRELTAC